MVLPIKPKVDQNEKPFDDSIRSLNREQFFNSTDKKIFDTNVHREYLSFKILLDINLEERRGKLRKLLETDENVLTDEHLSKIETQETRVKNLKAEAVRIRQMTELERQEVANTKKIVIQSLNNDDIRSNQAKYHLAAIVEDREKLKAIKERKHREEECEERFWTAKSKEIYDNLVAKENMKQDKKEEFKHDCLDQINERERDRQASKEENLENRKRYTKYAEIVDQQIKDEDLKALQDDIEKKAKYHKLLDNHIAMNKSMKEGNKNLEDTFDQIMIDENMQKLKNDDKHSKVVLDNNMKSDTNFMNYQNCLNQQRKADDLKMDEQVMKTQIELHKKRLEIEREKNRKYNNLIHEIKNAQKDQLIEAKKLKDLLVEEKKKDKLLAIQAYEESLRKDQLKLEKDKRKRDTHFNLARQHMVFNENLNKIRKFEHERERNSMCEAEKEYFKTISDIRSKDRLLFVHPWRAR